MQQQSNKAMNFLAHAYLSFEDPNLLVGNIIADMIKGKQIDTLPFEIQQGVYLHRRIDTFTDRHPIVKNAKRFFEEAAGRYGGAFLDVSYDHFLATSKEFEPIVGWHSFADNCYHTIESKAPHLPDEFISMFMYMKSENWFFNYRHKWLIEKSFSRLQNRATYLSDDANVYQSFEKYYDDIKLSFQEFFPDLVEFVRTNREE